MTRYWDTRLHQRGVVLTEYKPKPGEIYWPLIEGRYLDEHEAHGRHAIYITTLDEMGRKLPGVQVMFFNGGRQLKLTLAKPGEDSMVDFPMYAAGYGYGVKVLPNSDTVTRMGLGSIADPLRGIHVAYHFVFKRTTAGTPPAPPPSEPPVEPGIDIVSRLRLVQVRLEEGQDALIQAQRHFGAAQAMLQQVIDRRPQG